MFKRFLAFLNLLDHDGNLSITNVAVIVGITKMAFMTQLSGCDAVALVATLLNYGHKRLVNDNSNPAN